jgi:hypothetical protein
MAGQPLDGSWAQSRQQPQPYEQTQAYEQGQAYEQAQAPYQSYPPQQQYAPGTDAAGHQQAAYQGYPANQAEQAYQANQGYQANQEYQANHEYQAPGREARTAARSKGFIASLFDFSFSSFVTPKLIRVLYVLATIWTAVMTIAYCSLCLHFGDGGTMIIFLIISAPILFLLGIGSIRVALEVFMVLHRLNENIQAIRDRSDMS